MVFCVEAYDLRNYEDLYDHPENYTNPSLSLGFDILLFTCRDLGMNFLVFKMVCGSVELLLIYLAFNKTVKYVSFALGLFAIFPFTGTITQIRNSLAAAIVIYSVSVLIRNKKRAAIKFLIGITIAATIHFSTLFYMCILFFWKRSINFKKVIIISSIGTVLLYIAMLFSNKLYFIASMFISNERVLQWFSTINKSNLINIVIPTVEQIIGILMVKKGCKICKRNLTSFLETEELTYTISDEAKWVVENDDQAIDSIYKLNILSLLIIPFYMISPTFFRMYKYILPINYMVLTPASFMQNVNKNKTYGFVMNSYAIMVIGYSAVALFYESYSQGGFFELFNSFILFPIH